MTTEATERLTVVDHVVLGGGVDVRLKVGW
jgi:hypothetical protein